MSTRQRLAVVNVQQQSTDHGPDPIVRDPIVRVVWAIEEGRKAAQGVDKNLMYGETYLA